MEQLVYMMDVSKRTGKPVQGIGGLIANLEVQASRTLEHVSGEAQQSLGGLVYSKNEKGARIEQISRD